jgi:hypothetical protein
MPIAADYPFLDILFTMLIFFAWVVWIFIMILILSDVFRRGDVSGWGKAAWAVFLIVLPFVGVLVYLIAQHDGMVDRRTRDLQDAEAQMDEYVQSVAAERGPAAEIGRAKQLFDSGAIDEAEFDGIKTKALA